jgi:hypothetical protein
MGCGTRTEERGIECFPLAARAEDKENSVQADAVGRSGLASAEGMGIDMFGNNPLDLVPEVVGDAPGFGAFEFDGVRDATHDSTPV